MLYWRFAVIPSNYSLSLFFEFCGFLRYVSKEDTLFTVKAGSQPHENLTKTSHHYCVSKVMRSTRLVIESLDISWVAQDQLWCLLDWQTYPFFHNIPDNRMWCICFNGFCCDVWQGDFVASMQQCGAELPQCGTRTSHVVEKLAELVVERTVQKLLERERGGKTSQRTPAGAHTRLCF